MRCRSCHCCSVRRLRQRHVAKNTHLGCVSQQVSPGDRDDDSVVITGGTSSGSRPWPRSPARVAGAATSPCAGGASGGSGRLGGVGGTSANATAQGGRADEEGDLPTKMECVICMGGIKKPVVTKCGHLFCNCCIRDCACLHHFVSFLLRALHLVATWCGLASIHVRFAPSALLKPAPAASRCAMQFAGPHASFSHHL